MLLQLVLALLAVASDGNGAPTEDYCAWSEEELEVGDNCCYNPYSSQSKSFHQDETSEETSGSKSEESSGSKPEESSGSKSEESSGSKSEESSDSKSEESSGSKLEESSGSKSEESSDTTTDKSVIDSSDTHMDDRSDILSEIKKRKTSKGDSSKSKTEETPENNSENKKKFEALASKYFINFSAFERSFHSLNDSSSSGDDSSEEGTSESDDDTSESNEDTSESNDETSEEDTSESDESESVEIEECFEKYNSSSKHNEFYSLDECTEECIYEKLGFLTENKTIDIETITEGIAEILDEFSEWIEPLTRAAKSCLFYASKNLKPDNSCKSGSAQFEHCMLRKEFMVCPEKYWNNTNVCEGIKKKLTSCPFLLPPNIEDEEER